MPLNVMVVIGTRPELIKMAPVVHELLKYEPDVRTIVCSSGQHRQMLDQIAAFFEIEPDIDLKLMGTSPTLGGLAARALAAFDETVAEHQPDVVLVQGDTITAVAAALASFYHGVPVGHVEAGLRTGEIRSPFPEELHRHLVTAMSSWHFAPTEAAAAALLAEGIHKQRVFVTGNTVIDALLWATDQSPNWHAPQWLPAEGRLLLVTAHRRESFGAPLEEICLAVRELTERFDDIVVVFPVHLNPAVKNTVGRILGQRQRILLVDPLDYPTFVQVMKRATLILSDSGGIQEEAPAIGVPVLVVRDHSDRPEAIHAGAARLVGTDRRDIVDSAAELLLDEGARSAMTHAGSPFGDGHAAERIVSILLDRRTWNPTLPPVPAPVGRSAGS